MWFKKKIRTQKALDKAVTNGTLKRCIIHPLPLENYDFEGVESLDNVVFEGDVYVMNAEDLNNVSKVTVNNALVIDNYTGYTEEHDYKLIRTRGASVSFNDIVTTHIELGVVPPGFRLRFHGALSIRAKVGDDSMVIVHTGRSIHLKDVSGNVFVKPEL